MIAAECRVIPIYPHKINAEGMALLEHYAEKLKPQARMFFEWLSLVVKMENTRASLDGFMEPTRARVPLHVWPREEVAAALRACYSFAKSPISEPSAKAFMDAVGIIVIGHCSAEIASPERKI